MKKGRLFGWVRRRRHPAARALRTLRALGIAPSGRSRAGSRGKIGALAAGLAGGVGLAWWALRARGKQGEHRPLPPPETVPFVDLPRYMGTWYEIASYPRRFEKHCFGTTATYALAGAGAIEVVNRCRKRSLRGPERVVRGRARVVDPVSNAKLSVRLRWLLRGDYWIVELAPDYAWAAVATPERDGLWILSRTPTMDDETFAGIVTRLVKQGFEIGRLNRTVQSETSAAPMRGF